MYSFRQIEFIIKEYANVLPLDIFAFLGSFIEEIIPPIPAPLIMTTAGSIALEQGHVWAFLLWVAIIGSVGKTIASWIFYVLGDKFEHIVIGKYGKFVGIRQHDVETFGKKFTGGWGDDIGLFIFRAIPVFPSVSVSVVCGIIRLNMKTFIGATFLGTIVKNIMYLYAGYGGLQAIHFFARKIHQATFWFGLVFVIVSLGIIYWQVKKKKNIQHS
jgi:membrane protein DedA with SNARE-associated domain